MELTSHIQPLENDDFHYLPVTERTEELTYYVPGGFHPIIIGDVLSPSPDNESRQYRIMQKLGFGSYSTVWLAQKTDSSQAFVAVKVTMAEDGLTREAAMLVKAASSVQTTHLVTLLDHFTLRGPNGTHTVLVTDIVVPMPSLLSKKHRVWRKAAAHGLTQAVTHLHSAGIVHGDLHLGNIGSAMPQIANQDPETVMLHLDEHDITIVLPVHSSKKNPSLPAYILTPCDILAAYYQKIAGSDLPQTKIFDFGNAHEAGTLPLSFGCAMEACAPELAFAIVVEGIKNPPVELPADVWALGTAIYEIVAKSQLFHANGMLSLLLGMAAMTDSLPPTWLNWYSSLTNPPEVSASSADAWWSQQRAELRKNCADDASTDALVTLLKKVLVLDPASRPTAAQVLRDPWFLPADVLVKSMNNARL